MHAMLMKTEFFCRHGQKHQCHHMQKKKQIFSVTWSCSVGIFRIVCVLMHCVYVCVCVYQFTVVLCQDVCTSVCIWGCGGGGL